VGQDEEVPREGRDRIAAARSLAVPALLAAAACASAEDVPPAKPPSPQAAAERTSAPQGGGGDVAAPDLSAGAGFAVPLPAPAPDSVLWRVDGREVSTADLGDYVLRYLPDRAAEVLDQLLDEAVVEAEAARESVAVGDAEVARAADAYVEDRRRSARVQYGPATDFETLLRERWGRDLARFRADAVRLVRAALLRDRLVRLDQLREDGVEVRVLVLPSEEAARAAAASLRDGADMTRYADRAGVRRPSSPAPWARGEIPEKGLEARLFAASAGDVLDPVPFTAPDGGVLWQVFRVTRVWRGSPLPWESIGPVVEESLRAGAVTDAEYRRWRARAYARHRVVAADPAKGSVRTPPGR
jgi:hypothetical protein